VSFSHESTGHCKTIFAATDTDRNLSQIAEKTGLNYPEYLHTVFTRKIGITPGEFRRHADFATRDRFDLA
jgi:AraC-like DNA-binding protein